MTSTVYDWTITDIENITEEKAKEMALETMIVKEHNIYFVDFGGAFGYSCLVFKNNHHIFYANDYELHHAGKTKGDLREWYIAGAYNKLFTESEIAAPIKDYDEYTRKEYFLRNYYGMQQDHVSIFHIHKTEEEAEEYRKNFEGKVYNPVSLAYYDDAGFVNHHIELFESLIEAKKNIGDDFDYWKSAFKTEMYNHEYCYNWQADYDVLSVFGRITFNEADDELKRYFDELNFSEVRRAAYFSARKEYYKELRSRGEF